MILTTKYSNQVLRFLKGIDVDLNFRIQEKIRDLCEDPFPRDSKRIEGTKLKLFRVRIGKYRILYEVDYSGGSLGIVKIDKREKVYD